MKYERNLSKVLCGEELASNVNSVELPKMPFEEEIISDQGKACTKFVKVNNNDRKGNETLEGIVNGCNFWEDFAFLFSSVVGVQQKTR